LLYHSGDGQKLSAYQSAVLAYLSGVVWYAGNCYWIYRTMHVYESIPAIASFGILLLFALYLGLYHALFGAIIGIIHTRNSRTVSLGAIPFAWVAVELARSRITGFPWDLLGYTQVSDLFLIRIAPWTGVMGLSFVVVCVNVLWLLRFNTRDRWIRYAPTAIAALITVSVTLTVVLYHPPVVEPTQAIATLVQENLGVGNEAGAYREGKDQMIAAFTQLSLHPVIRLKGAGGASKGRQPERTQIIVWPEAPTDFVDSDPVLRQAMGSLAVQTGAAVIVNDVTFAPLGADGQRNLYNSASFYNPDGSYAGRYDKMHLVPFGEYTPYKPLFFFVGHLLDDLVFVPGTERTLFSVGDKKYGVFICYESIFGDDLRQFARSGAQALINISDDGWYGDTSAPWEHLDMVRMRAIENRRWIVRATNTGITAVIDPLGRITATVPRHVRTSVQVAFGYRSDLTFYSEHGDWFGWLCVLVTVALLVYGIWGRRFIARSEVN
jgi:apolipoprotein N-acyltransferase